MSVIKSARRSAAIFAADTDNPVNFRAGVRTPVIGGQVVVHHPDMDDDDGGRTFLTTAIPVPAGND